jgi:hypothetical protein
MYDVSTESVPDVECDVTIEDEDGCAWELRAADGGRARFEVALGSTVGATLGFDREDAREVTREGELDDDVGSEVGVVLEFDRLGASPTEHTGAVHQQGGVVADCPGAGRHDVPPVVREAPCRQLP